LDSFNIADKIGHNSKSSNKDMGPFAYNASGGQKSSLQTAFSETYAANPESENKSSGIKMGHLI